MTTVTTRTRRSEPALLVDAVFDGQRTSKPGIRAFAWLCALAAHVGLFFLAQLAGPSLETWSARVAAMVHHDLNAHAPTSIEAEPREPSRAPEPTTPPPPPAQAPPPTTAASSPPRTRAPQPTAAPAQAAKVVATEPQDTGAVDLTDNTFVTGTADAYAGGATASHGTSAQAVPRSALESTQPAPPAAEPSGSGAQPVRLMSEQWHCPWPQAALAQDLYEQAVIVRALVRADGSVERASVLSDPGYGFGAAAIDCTLRTRFNPARDAHGQPRRALSPPIRVRFTR